MSCFFGCIFTNKIIQHPTKKKRGVAGSMNPHGLFGPASKAQVTNHLNAFALLENLELREDEEQQHESYNMTPLHVAVVENNVTDPRPIGFGVISCPARV